MQDLIVQSDPVKVQNARKAKGLTQDQLLTALQHNGIKLELRALQAVEMKDISRGGGRVRRIVLQTIADILDVTYDSLLPDGHLPWRIPKPEWKDRENSPGALLQAEMAIVPFELRKEEIQGLEDWCRTGEHLRIKLICGRGGMGKTRLALEFCRRLIERHGWRAGFLDYDAFRPNDEQWNTILLQAEPLLLVFDYAEVRFNIIAWLLAKLNARASGKVRVLLLARHIGDFWSQLKSNRACGDLLASKAMDEPSELRPLVARNRNDHARSYQHACTAFAEKLGKPVSGKMPADIGDPIYDPILLLHIRALASLDSEDPKGEKPLLDYLLTREKRFWIEQLAARSLDPTLLVAVEEAMVTVTSNGGIRTALDGIEMLKSLPSLDGRPADVRIALNNLLSECYPGEQWIAPVQPDLFGERLFQIGFTANPELKAKVFQNVVKAVRIRKPNA